MANQAAVGVRLPLATADSDGARLGRRVTARLGFVMAMASLDGALTVFCYLTFVLPHPNVRNGVQWLHVSVVGFVVYMAWSLGAGGHWCRRASAPIRAWLASGRPATAGDRRRVLKLPLQQSVISGSLWLLAALVFGSLTAAYSRQFAVDVAMTVVFGGLATTALCYLLAERIVRPILARALADQPADDCARLGVGPRIVLTWVFTTGIPLLGIALAFCRRSGAPAASLVAPTYFLVILGLALGLVGIWMSTKRVTEPLAALRAALAEVGAGRTDVRVRVDDGSEVGQLQAGFNQMVAGLRERQVLRDLFGRHVGEDVARRALDRGVELGGESVDAAVLFVDMIDSTGLAETRPPAEVMAVLNQFFGVVVDVVTAHGGWVNKFEGDGALCVFGAPQPRGDAATCALAAARELREQLGTLDGVRAAVGVTAGTVVGGNVGSEARYEYTVIGDPVNEAARLTELAKTRAPGLLASLTAVARADTAEAARWMPGGHVALRGRSAATHLAVPVTSRETTGV